MDKHVRHHNEGRGGSDDFIRQVSTKQESPDFDKYSMEFEGQDHIGGGSMITNFQNLREEEDTSMMSKHQP